MANRIASLAGLSAVRKSDLVTWWGQRRKTRGVDIVRTLAAEAYVVESREVIEGFTASVVRLTQKGMEAVMDGRRKLADRIMAGEAA